MTDRIEAGNGEQTGMLNASPERRTCASMSDRRVRLPVGHFVGEAWYVVSQCRAYRYRFVRMWDFYLATAEMAFRLQWMMVFQVQLAKRQGIVPITRNYISSEETRLRALENGRRPPLRLAGE